MICCKRSSAADSCCYGSRQCKTGQLAATMHGSCRCTANGLPSREQYSASNQLEARLKAASSIGYKPTRSTPAQLTGSLGL